MANEKPVMVEGLWKRYGLPPSYFSRGAAYNFARQLYYTRNPLKAYQWMKEKYRSPERVGGHWPLKDISFEMEKGEILGILGRNGTGKSTLLKILAGITPPSFGRVEVRGRSFAMIQLSAGLHRELTGRENARVLSTVMGLTGDEIKEKIKKVEEFCELGPWFDRVVRTYSTGMLGRLGFGVAINVDADILFIDEVLAVGDLVFQRKCLTEMERLYSSGKTIIFVSHSPQLVARICNKVMVIHNGGIHFLGDTQEGIKDYEKLIRDSEQRDLSGKPEGSPEEVEFDFGEIRYHSAELLVNGQPQTEIKAGDPVEIRLRFRVEEDLEKAAIVLKIDDVQNRTLVWYDLKRKDIKAGEYEIVHKIDQMWLIPATYDLRFEAAVGQVQRKSLRVYKALTFSVTGPTLLRGIVHPPAEWEWRPAEGPPPPIKKTPKQDPEPLFGADEIIETVDI